MSSLLWIIFLVWYKVSLLVFYCLFLGYLIKKPLLMSMSYSFSIFCKFQFLHLHPWLTFSWLCIGKEGWSSGFSHVHMDIPLPLDNLLNRLYLFQCIFVCFVKDPLSVCICISFWEPLSSYTGLFISFYARVYHTSMVCIELICCDPRRVLFLKSYFSMWNIF